MIGSNFSTSSGYPGGSGVWRYQILLRSPHRAGLRRAVESVMLSRKLKGVDVAIDVDPINIL